MTASTCIFKNCLNAPMGNHGYCAAHYQAAMDDMNRKAISKGFTERSAATLPNPVPVKLDAVVEANRALLLYRSQVGLAKYGTPLSTAKLSHRQILQHALEEALDLANYLQTQIMQMDAAGEA